MNLNNGQSRAGLTILESSRLKSSRAIKEWLIPSSEWRNLMTDGKMIMVVDGEENDMKSLITTYVNFVLHVLDGQLMV